MACCLHNWLLIWQCPHSYLLIPPNLYILSAYYVFFSKETYLFYLLFICLLVVAVGSLLHHVGSFVVAQGLSSCDVQAQ